MKCKKTRERNDNKGQHNSTRLNYLLNLSSVSEVISPMSLGMVPSSIFLSSLLVGKKGYGEKTPEAKVESSQVQ